MPTMEIKYLIRKRGKKVAAHYWTGNDTFCRMWSTGGMGMRSKGRYLVCDNPNGHQVCTMCSNVARRT